MCIRDSQNAARALMAEVNPLKHRMEAFSALKSRLEDIDAAIELAPEADEDVYKRQSYYCLETGSDGGGVGKTAGESV